MQNSKFSTQLCLTINIQNVYYLPEICEWISQQTFNHVYFNMLHDPWHMNISRMTPTAQQLVLDKFASTAILPKYRAEILRVSQFYSQWSRQ
jgi:hypothetical protein